MSNPEGFTNCQTVFRLAIMKSLATKRRTASPLFRGLRSRRFVSAEEFARAEGVGLPDERSEELCEAKSQEAEPLSCLARR